MRCKIHKTDSNIYLPRRGYAVCLDCVKAGFYNEEISEEAIEEDAAHKRRIDSNLSESSTVRVDE